MSDPVRRCVMAIALLVAAGPAVAVMPVDHPSQLLAEMAGRGLMLSSPGGRNLIDRFFAPRPGDAAPCLSSTGTQTGFDMICHYHAPEPAEDLLLGIVGRAPEKARIASVLWRYPVPGSLWRCAPGLPDGWHVCFPKTADRRADAASVAGWERLLRSHGRLVVPTATQQLQHLLADAVRRVP